MSWPQPVVDSLRRLKMIRATLTQTLIERDVAVDLLLLAALCREHFLLLGPPGTAKTELLTRFVALIDGKSFHYLLTRFTEPAELFGALDIDEFRKGRFVIRTHNMLPDAEVVFLDEVFQGNSAILNALLVLINERVFHNGAHRQPTPLISLVGASNDLPDDPGLCAFSDRFALRLRLDSVPDDCLDDLLSQGWSLEQSGIRALMHPTKEQPILPAADLAALHQRVAEVSVKEIQPIYVGLIRSLRAEGVTISDRRLVKGLKLAAGAALMRQATTASVEDLWPLRHFWNRAEEAEAIGAAVDERIREAGGEIRSLARPEAELLTDLAIIETRRPTLRSEAAIGAHLTDLNRLRREALRDHRSNAELRRKIDETIISVMKLLETAGV